MTGIFRNEWSYYQPQRLATVPTVAVAAGVPFNPQRSAALRDPDEEFFQQKDRRTTHLVATPANDLGQPLLQGDAGAYWHVYNKSVDARPRSFFEYEQRRRDSTPSGIDTLDSPLLGAFGDGSTYWHLYDIASDFRQRALDELRQRRRDSGPLDQGLLEVARPLLDRTTVTHQRLPWLRIEPVRADQSTAALVSFDPTQAGELNARRVPFTHVDRREVPRQQINFASIDPTTMVGTGMIGAWWSIDDTVHHWPIPRSIAVPDQPAGTPPDPTQTGYGWIAELIAATHADRRRAPKQQVNFAPIDVVVGGVQVVGTGAIGAWWSIDDTVHHWPGQRVALVNQGAAAGPDADPLLLAYIKDQLVNLSPVTHDRRRPLPTRHQNYADADVVSMIGTGTNMGWWGVDDSAHHFAQWMPMFSVPEVAPGTPADPLFLVDSTRRERAWLVRPWFGLQRQAIIDQSSAPVAPLPPELWAYLAQRVAQTWPVDRRLVPQQMLRQAFQGEPPAPVFDPTQAGYGPLWRWYRPPVAPVQRELESDPRLLLTALLENELLGAWEDLQRHRTWYVSRRLVPQQRTYPDEIKPPANPLLVSGAEWRYKLIPVTHKARWVLRQWWQQQLFRGADPLLFEGTVVGGILGGASVLGGGTLGGSLTGFSRDGNLTGEVR